MSNQAGRLSGLPVEEYNVFSSLPGHFALVKADAPIFTLLAVTNDFASLLGLTENDIGKSFVENIKPGEPAGEIHRLLDSFGQVLHAGSEDRITDFHYGPRPSDSPSSTSWSVINKPVFDLNSSVVSIIHILEPQQQNNRAVKDPEDGTTDKAYSLFMQAPVAVCIVKGPGYIVELANDGMLAFLGRTSAIVGHPIEESLTEAKKQGLIAILDYVRKTGQPYHAPEFPAVLLINGVMEQRYFDLVFSLYDQNPNDPTTTRVFCVAYNVTELVLARQKVEANESELQLRVQERTAALVQQQLLMNSILQASFNGVYAIQAIRDSQHQIVNFRYLFANKVFIEMLGKPEEEIVGSLLSEVITAENLSGWFNVFCDTIHKGEAKRDETAFETHAGVSWFDYLLFPIENDIIVITVQNITTHKTSMLQIEQQRNLLDNILKHSPSGISVTETIRNNDGEIIDARTILANAVAEKFSGVPMDDMLSKKASEIDRNLLQSPLFHQAKHTLATGEAFITQYYFEPAGRWLELAVARMDENRLINVFSDITNIKESQFQLEKYIDDLKKSNSNLEQFAYAASHDLKEPIRKILIFADRLKKDLQSTLTENQQRLFDRMEHSTHRMGALIEDLLAYSHVSMGVSHFDEVDLNVKVQNVLEDLEIEIQQKQAKIVVGTLPRIKAHRRQMQQLFQNLIGNALKYVHPNRVPEVHISATRIQGRVKGLDLSIDVNNKPFYLIEVRDNGIGFNQEEAVRIFNVFTRLHGNAEYTGTGVGLSIVRRVVENHNGYIWAEGKPGEGATFKVLLPAEY
ncbi:PAS domain-containing sensor histidine kinase [Segetibacter sp. 3557_3]|uniref:sensor histidine kinase n=1 Tax=Segetibacter sp. 3557_3 TaxID=2547429 RepID=UPI001058DE53|nr:PAS domain-containing sensor histidine kinase [Segetibacter sp. 3557_3]TDH24169.1 PAS domain-containing sensor histidine kinase [Segetibacter sp. 3557_3]